MASLKNYFQTLIIPFSSVSRSRSTQAFSILLLTLALFFFFSISNNSPDISSANSLSSRLHFASIYISSLSSIISSNTQFVSSSQNTCSSDAVTELSPARKKSRKFGIEEEDITSCDIFDGNWVLDDSNSYPLYKPGSCPFIDDSFNCFKNGRPDSDYLRLRWKPHGCHIPRFNSQKSSAS